MTSWLAGIVGVVVIGVVVELLTQRGRMGTFVRAIYSFIVLFVIVSPLPKLLKKDWVTWQTDDLVNAELVNNIAQTSQQNQVRQKLRALGYPDALVTAFEGVIYVNLGVSVDAATLADLQNNLGKGVVIV